MRSAEVLSVVGDDAMRVPATYAVTFLAGWAVHQKSVWDQPEMLEAIAREATDARVARALDQSHEDVRKHVAREIQHMRTQSMAGKVA